LVFVCVCVFLPLFSFSSHDSFLHGLRCGHHTRGDDLCVCVYVWVCVYM
jgi:hypothetical protein